MIFQIVAVFVTDTEFDYVRPEFETKKERTEYLETVAEESLRHRRRGHRGRG